MTSGWGTVTVKIGWRNLAFDTVSALDNETADVLSITTQSSKRSSPLDPFGAGSATLELDNSDRHFDPLDTTGPNYQALDAFRQVQISANDSGGTTRRLWTGFVCPPPAGWAYSYPNGRDAVLSLQCADGFMFLDNFTLNAVAPIAGGQYAGALIGYLLDQIGWPASWRSLDTGRVVMQAIPAGQYNVGTLIRDIARSDLGAFYFDPSTGNATFDQKHAVLTDARMTASQATFSDTGSDVDMQVIEWAYGGAMRNDWQVSSITSAMQEVSDTASISNHGYSQQAETGMYMANDADVYNVAAWGTAAYKDLLFTPSTIEIEATDSNAALDQACNRLLRDRVTVSWTPPGGSHTTNTASVFVEDIRHSIPINANPNLWTTTFGVQAADRFGWTTPTQYLKLDDATFGKLDTARLAF